MAYELTDDQVLRFSYGKSMGRYHCKISEVLSNLGMSSLVPTASGGNPGLEPLESENIDLAYEYYYDEGSYFQLITLKDIDNFISSDVSLGAIDGLSSC